METYKTVVLVIDGILGLIIILGLLFGDWEYLLSEEGSSLLVIVLGIILFLLFIIILLTFWAFKIYKPVPSSQMSSTKKFHPITYVGLLIFLVGSIINVSSTFTDPGLTAVGATLMIIGAIIFLFGMTLKKSAT